MKKKMSIIFLTVINLLISQVAYSSDSLSIETAKSMLSNQPVKIEENLGQMMDMDGNPVDYVLFKMEAPGIDFYITETGLTYTFKQLRKEPLEKEELAEFGLQEAKEKGKPVTKKIYNWERIDLILKNASISKNNIIKEQPSNQGSLNYFYPHCSKGIYEVKEYGRITIKNVYPNIDWVFYKSSDQGYKYDFVLHPGANPADIQLIYRSKEKLVLTKKGNIIVTTQYGDLIESAPISFMDEKIIDSKFKLISTQQNQYGGYDANISFELADYPKQKTVVIDPQLTWSTFYGGNDLLGPMDITVDQNNNVFIVGYVTDVSFPVQNASTFFQGTSGGGMDAFVLRFDDLGTRIWATYYGGSADDQAISVAIDGNNNVIVLGQTISSNFPIQDAGTFFQGTNSGGWDAFILKFDNMGNRIWATYYGAGTETVHSVAVDSQNNVFIVGATQFNLPVQDAGTFFQSTSGGGMDAFILKFDNMGNRLWATHYGGSGHEIAYSVAIDDQNNVFIVGSTQSIDLPVQDAGTFFQGTNVGGADIFILKFDNVGNRLWATYYGGEGKPNSVAVDDDNNVFIVGRTSSLSFPVQDAGTFFQGTNGGGEDAFILKFDNIGNRLWATYYGGGTSIFTGMGNEEAFSVKVGDCNNIYVGIFTSTSNTPVQPFCDGGYFDNSFNGIRDNLFAKFSNSGTLMGATYLGGDGYDIRPNLALDNLNNLYITGEWTGVTNSTTYPLVNPGGGAYYDPSFNGNDDGYVAKFSTSISTGSLIMDSTVSCNCTGTVTVNLTALCPPYNYFWSNGDTTWNSTDDFSTITNLCAGMYTVTVEGNCFSLRDSIEVTGIVTLIGTDVQTACNTYTWIDGNT